jgi:hypothetical protein
MITLAHKPSAVITAIFLLIVAIVHLIRLINGTNVTVGTMAVPVWISFPAFVIAAGLAVWLWFDTRR